MSLKCPGRGLGHEEAHGQKGPRTWKACHQIQMSVSETWLKVRSPAKAICSSVVRRSDEGMGLASLRAVKLRL
jgi:hypothetical protein